MIHTSGWTHTDTDTHANTLEGARRLSLKELRSSSSHSFLFCSVSSCKQHNSERSRDMQTHIHQRRETETRDRREDAACDHVRQKMKKKKMLKMKQMLKKKKEMRGRAEEEDSRLFSLLKSK